MAADLQKNQSHSWDCSAPSAIYHNSAGDLNQTTDREHHDLMPSSQHQIPEQIKKMCTRLDLETASLKLPVPESFKFVTTYTLPVRPPVACAPKPVFKCKKAYLGCEIGQAFSAWECN